MEGQGGVGEESTVGNLCMWFISVLVGHGVWGVFVNPVCHVLWITQPVGFYGSTEIKKCERYPAGLENSYCCSIDTDLCWVIVFYTVGQCQYCLGFWQC